jgi:hypothetical protein
MIFLLKPAFLPSNLDAESGITTGYSCQASGGAYWQDVPSDLLSRSTMSSDSEDKTHFRPRTVQTVVSAPSLFVLARCLRPPKAQVLAAWRSSATQPQRTRRPNADSSPGHVFCGSASQLCRTQPSPLD